MSDIYQAPQSELTQDQDAADIEAALARAAAGDFEFRPVAVVSESWELIKGAKLPILLGFIAIYVVSFLVQIVGALIWTPEPSNFGGALFGSLVLGVLQMMVTTPLWGGMLYMGIRRAAGNPASVNDIGSQFSRAGALIVTGVLSMALIYVGFLLLIVPGIYLSVAYLQAIPLVIDKGLSPWQALEASRKAITRCWFRMFGLMLLVGVIFVIAALPLLIGLIWAIPLSVVVFGVAYRSIFGITSTADSTRQA